MEPAVAQTLEPLVAAPASHHVVVAPIIPTSGPGSVDEPLGAGNPQYEADSFRLGLRCACGRVVFVYSGLYDSQEPLACPGCQTSLR